MENKVSIIREKYVKGIDDLEKIYKDSQFLVNPVCPGDHIYPMFRLAYSHDPDNLYFCNKQDIDDGSFGYVFYTPGEHPPYEDFDYYIPVEGCPEPDLSCAITPDQLIYTGQNFSALRHKIGDSDSEFFTISNGGEETDYNVFQATADNLADSDRIVLGAWYFAPCEDVGVFPFSDGYKTKQDARNAAFDHEIRSSAEWGEKT
jgi:hypothetical protein